MSNVADGPHPAALLLSHQSGSSSLRRSSFGSYRDFLAHPLALIIISILVRLNVWYSHPLWYDPIA
jgi:hypothetical protein